MKLTDFEIDPARLEEGAWVDDLPEMGGLRLKVRGAGNADWNKLQRKLADTVPRKRRINGFSQEDLDRITSTCLQNCGLLDWEGVEDKDGNALPYSKEMAHQFCFDTRYKKMREAILYACNIVAETKDADKDDIVKN